MHYTILNLYGKMLNNNDKKTSFLQLILLKYSGTPLIRSPMGQKRLAVLIR